MTSAFSTHLEKLKTFVPPKDDGVNKIYFLEVVEKPGKVKAGDTHRDVERRNQETMTNASLHRKPGTEPIYVVAKMWDGTVFRDKKFHTFLKQKKYTFEKINPSVGHRQYIEYVRNLPKK
jgi:3,4-dihydroxy-2-butanone 4-phosphate synthase